MATQQHFSKMTSPITNALSEVKRAISVSYEPFHSSFSACAYRLWRVVRGSKSAVVLLTIILGLAGGQALREILIDPEVGLPLALLVVSLGPGICIVWVNAVASLEAAAFLDEILWVANLLEQDVPGKIHRRNVLSMRIARVYFWMILWTCIFYNVVVVVEAVVNYTHLPMPLPLPDIESFGENPSIIIMVALQIYEIGVVINIAMAYCWVDGLFFGCCLVIYGLTKLLAVSIRRTDLKREPDQFRRLLRAHQILLEAGNACNKYMSAIYCLVIIAQTLLNVVTLYKIVVEPPTILNVVDVFFGTIIIIRLGVTSELMMQASLEVGTALYDANWLDIVFSDGTDWPTEVQDFCHTMVIVITRSDRPMHLRAGFIGILNNQFIVKFFKALFTYYQTLNNLL